MSVLPHTGTGGGGGQKQRVEKSKRTNSLGRGLADAGVDLRFWWSVTIGNGDLAKAAGGEVCGAEQCYSPFLWVAPHRLSVREVHVQRGCWRRVRDE